jgi:proton-dependent oligopeptide transporter, POT family
MSTQQDLLEELEDGFGKDGEVASAELNAIQNFKGTYPKQLYSLAFTEMWERFCFYGNRSLLTLFMADKVVGLNLTEGDSNLKYGAIQAFVYAFTFIGGLFADKILGFKKSLFWGAILMILANALLFFNAQSFFYVGMCLLIVGTGFFKPNISTMVGSLYKEGDVRRDAGFGLFYSGINMGATLAGLLCPLLAVKYGYGAAFGASAVVMIIGLAIFLFTRKSLGPIGNPPKTAMATKQNDMLVYAGSILAMPLVYIMIRNTAYTDMFMYIIGPLTLVYIFMQARKYNSVQRKQLLAAVIFSVFSIIFWAFFEQSGGSLNLFASNNLNDKFLGMTLLPTSVNNSANSIFVIIFSALLGIVWVALAKRKIEPNAIIKFGLGFLFLAAAFYIFYLTKNYADASGKTGLGMFIFGYFIITFGELCLSPIGLSLMTKLSPKPMWGLMMGLWFLASAYGQYVAGILGAGMSSPDANASNMDKLISYTSGYKQLGIYALIAGVVLIAISPLIKKLMGGVK